MKATQAILRATGGPEVIEWSEVELGAPGLGQALVEHFAVGVNFIDVYHRTGAYPAPVPARLGLEAAGRVIAVGNGVTDVAPGDRVVTFGPERGAYSTARLVSAAALIKLPDDIDDDTAAAIMLKGCTTEFLVERCAKVQPGDDVLVHAAAGGVGQLLVQWLVAIGARVIAHVGSEAKAQLVRDLGAAEVLAVPFDQLAEKVRALTGGTGVSSTFDGVGKASWHASLKSTARRGLIASFGSASGVVDGVALGILAQHGSLFVTRPTLFDYYTTMEDRSVGAARLFAMIRAGKLEAAIGQRYPLTDAAPAHRDLEARKTTGATLLIP